MTVDDCYKWYLHMAMIDSLDRADDRVIVVMARDHWDSVTLRETIDRVRRERNL